MTQNKNPFQKMFATFVARAVFVFAILLLFPPKTAIFDKNLYYIYPPASKASRGVY
jgi:hypothetical protein